MKTLLSKPPDGACDVQERLRWDDDPASPGKRNAPHPDTSRQLPPCSFIRAKPVLEVDMRAKRNDAVGECRLHRAPIIGQQCRRTALGHQAAKQLQIVQIQPAGAPATDRQERVPHMVLQPFRSGEVSIEGHEHMPLVGEDAVGEIDRSDLRAADGKAGKDVKQGLGHDTASKAGSLPFACAPCLRKASSIRTNQSSVLRSALPCACSSTARLTRSRST